MTTQNRPCTNPALCGVKTHRPGTASRCQETRSSTDKGTRQALASPPPTSAAPTAGDRRVAAQKRVAGMNSDQLRGGLRRAGVNFEDTGFGQEGKFIVNYPDRDGELRWASLPYDKQGNLDKQKLARNPDFGSWYEDSTCTSPVEPSVTEGSMDDRIAAVTDRVYDGEQVDLEMKTEGNTRRFLLLNREHDTDGELNADNLMTARIQTSNGKVVTAARSDVPMRYTFADGVTRENAWVEPIGAQGFEVSGLITSREYDQLAELQAQADSMGLWSDLDPEEELTYETRTDLSIQRALAAVDADK